jgi:acetylglutamate kinase
VDDVIAKAAGMIEALPFIQRFRNETVVVKLGGCLLDDEPACREILKDICFMEVVGLRPVIVHGGGKVISRRMEEARLTPEFRQGLRVTDADTIRVVEHALNHEVNPQLVRILESLQCRACGIHGQTILTSRKYIREHPETGECVEWGHVGEVIGVDIPLIRACLDSQTVPVITPLGRGSDGTIYNINADDAAAAVAREVRARKLVYLSDVPGLLRDPADRTSLISHVKARDVTRLIEQGILNGGMIPKIRSAVKTTEAGVNKVHIIDSSLPHSLLLELFTEKGVGTEIVRS